MRFFTYFLCLLGLLAFAAGCSSSVTPPPSGGEPFQAAGLEGLKINSFNTFNGSIYASTDGGLYERKPNSVSWDSRGLQQDSVLNVAFLPGNKLLAAVRTLDFSSEEIPTLFLSTNNGQTWSPHMGNYGGKNGKYTLVLVLAASYKPSDTLYTQASGGVVARSFDGGKHWENVHGGWDGYGGYGEKVLVDPTTKGKIWVGGENAIFHPLLLKSKDYGKNWDYLTVYGGESIVNDIIIKYKKPNHILAGLSSSIFSANIIRKSTDDGKTWHTVKDSIRTNTFTHSARDPQVIYASGQNTKGTLFFAASSDFGDSWQTVEWKNSPGGFHVNDMVSVMQDGKEVLYLGTNKGVYRYRFAP